MALEFDGTNFVQVADVAVHRTTPMTVCFWVYLAAAPAADCAVIAKSGGAGNRCWAFQMDAANPWYPIINCTESGIEISFNAGPFPTGSWQQISFFMQANPGTMRAYRNAALGGGPGPSGTIVETCALRIGSYGNTGDPVDRGLVGLVEDVRIYDRQISGAEVTAIYNGGVGGGVDVDGVTSGLISNWQLVGAPGTPAAGAGSVLDLVGGYNGTPFNSPIYRQGLLPQTDNPKAYKRAFCM